LRFDHLRAVSRAGVSLFRLLRLFGRNEASVSGGLLPGRASTARRCHCRRGE
jgi:hypothetical protein